MSADRKPAEGASKKSEETGGAISPHEKIARLLGIMAVKGMNERTEQVTLLRAVGFEVSEVASMLGITENNVSVLTHHGRKKRQTRRAAKRGKSKE